MVFQVKEMNHQDEENFFVDVSAFRIKCNVASSWEAVA